LFEQNWDKELTPAKIEAMQTLGVPYEEGFAEVSVADAEKQAAEIVAELETQGVKVVPEKEIVALIAYLQRIGTDIKKVDELTQK
ncbi:MAG TPA: cytochrome C oxidase Cbb3, partial [Cytophagales bacterium]|nr:cytochrome C oxidase Cbb3 [Cytophagales bacterium]